MYHNPCVTLAGQRFFIPVLPLNSVSSLTGG
jgi:hypothetical protein